MHKYLEAHGTFPPAAIRNGEGTPLLSWRVAILPFLGEDALFREFHLDEPWDGEHNKRLLKKMPSVYQRPASPASNGTTSTQAIVGRGAAFEGTEGQPLSAFTDGVSNTVLVTLQEKHPVPWTKPDDLALREVEPNFDSPSMGLPAQGIGRLALLADGTVRYFPNQPSPMTLRAIITRSGGEVLSQEEFGQETRGKSSSGSASGIVDPLGPGAATPGIGEGRTGSTAGGLSGGMMGAPGAMSQGGAMSGMAGGMSGGPGAGGMAGGREFTKSSGRGMMAAGSGAMKPAGAGAMKRGTGMGAAVVAGGAAGGMPGMGEPGLTPAASPAGDSERRLAALEAQMERLLKEIESLRKEQRGGDATRR